MFASRCSAGSTAQPAARWRALIARSNPCRIHAEIHGPPVSQPSPGPVRLTVYRTAALPTELHLPLPPARFPAVRKLVASVPVCWDHRTVARLSRSKAIEDAAIQGHVSRSSLGTRPIKLVSSWPSEHGARSRRTCFVVGISDPNSSWPTASTRSPPARRCCGSSVRPATRRPATSGPTTGLLSWEDRPVQALGYGIPRLAAGGRGAGSPNGMACAGDRCRSARTKPVDRVYAYAHTRGYRGFVL